MPDRELSPKEVARLKRRRDKLLNTACTRQERRDLLSEVRQINQRLREVDAGNGRRS